MITNQFFAQNDGKRISHQKRRFGMTFRETEQNLLVLSKNDVQTLFYTKNVVLAQDLEKVITNQVLTQNDGKRLWHQKRRFGMRFRERVQSLLVSSKNVLQTHFAQRPTFCNGRNIMEFMLGPKISLSVDNS